MIGHFRSPLPNNLMDIVATYLEADHRTYEGFCALYQFNHEQRMAYDAAVGGGTSHVLVLGAGGTGKSHVIRALRASSAKTKVCAFTGAAANNVNGITIDRLLHTRPGMISGLDFVIIDEISMCSHQKLSHLIHLGAKRLIMFGDFAQLPPTIQEIEGVPDTEAYNRELADTKQFFRGRDPGTGAIFAFEHDAFRSIIPIVLTQQYRQRPGELQLHRVLSDVRKGIHSMEVYQMLHERHQAYLSLAKRNTMVHLYYHKDRVKQHNDMMLEKLRGNPEFLYEYTHEWVVRLNRRGFQHSVHPDPLITECFRDLREELRLFYMTYELEYAECLDTLGNLRQDSEKKVWGMMVEPLKLSELAQDILSNIYPTLCVPAPRELLDMLDPSHIAREAKKRILVPQMIRVDQLVMITKNLLGGLLTNGTTGTVTAVSKYAVELDGEKTVGYTNFDEMVQIRTRNDEDRVRLISRVRGMPLMGANAMTIHKAQGLTLPQVVLFLGNCTILSSGLAYVALSRCVSTSGLFIGEEPHRHAITADFACTEFDKKVTTNAGICDIRHAVTLVCNRCSRFYHQKWATYRCRCPTPKRMRI